MKSSEKRKISSNLIFYTSYQILIYLVPFIISPFLTRTLGDESLGRFAFTNSIAYYFVLLANLGIARFGQREISANKDNKVQTRFWSLYFVHLILSFISLGVFTALLFTVFKSEFTLYLLCSIYILSALFDVSWLFFGLDEFKLVTSINGVFAIIKMILIFFLIRNPNHIYIYASLYYGALLLSNITLFAISFKKMGKPKLDISTAIKYIKPLLFFSLAVVAVALYTVFDKTLIGIFINNKEVAYYEYADRIIGIPKMLLLTIGAVLFPKMCSLESKKEYGDMQALHHVSLFFTVALSVGSIFGLLAIGQTLVTTYYGEMFSKSGDYVVLLSPIILFITLGDLIRTQFIIPMKKDKFYLFSVILNAITNLVISLILINFIGIYGVIIGTLTLASLFPKTNIDELFIKK